MTHSRTHSADKPTHTVKNVVIRFAGDSGDGMQLIGDRFTSETAVFGNDLATLPNFPAEIRAPAGTLPGVSSFQLHFADHDILTPGDLPDVLVAMNPAALKANLADLPSGGVVIANTDEFTKRNLTKVGYEVNPLEDETLSAYTLHAAPLTKLGQEAAKPHGVSTKDARRAKNMVALGLLCWMYNRPTEQTLAFLRRKFSHTPELAEAAISAFHTGWNYGETTESFTSTYEVLPAPASPGEYRNISGNIALSYGLLTAAHLSEMPLFLGAYPITPASDVLHEVAKHKKFGVRTFQAEDEIAAAAAALGASYGGSLGVTSTAGPGVVLKSEVMGLAVTLELPLVMLDIQRAGPSTGMPTKTEQADLLLALFGRHGESPMPVFAPATPAECFTMALEAARTAITYRTPVMLLSDGSLANGAEPWRIPDVDDLPSIRPEFAIEPNHGDEFWPYLRDSETLARAWAIPGTPGLEHRMGGLEKTEAGAISYDPENHHRMVSMRAEKVANIAVPPVRVDDPDGDAELLVLGWGSTYGAIQAAARELRAQGKKVAHIHLRHLNPMPKNLGEVLRQYKRVIVPELNLGQLSMLVRAQYLVDARGYNQVRGVPFSRTEMMELMRRELGEMA